MEPLKLKNKVAAYRLECIQLFDLEIGVKDISSFINKVEKLSLPYKLDNVDPEGFKTFKGDMLEILAEIFFGAFRNDPAIGLRNYEPIPIDEDYGVDAIGINVNNDDCAVQVKYRANPLESIKYEDLSKTYTSARIRNNLSLDHDNTLYLFTTSYDITIACGEVFANKLRVINRSVIASRIDNNNSFWEEAQLRIALTFELLMNGVTV
jgi:hypothetical protein